GDVVAVADRLVHRVGEAEEQQVLDWLLAQVVVDAEDGGLGEVAVQRGVQLACGGEVVPERLLDDHPGVPGGGDPGQAPGHRLEQAGRDGQVVQRPLGLAHRLFQPLVGGRVGVVAVDVPEQRHQPREGLLIEAPVLLDALPGPLPQLLQPPTRPGDADDRHVEVAVADHRLQRREDLLVREVAGGAEEDQRVRPRTDLAHPATCAVFSMWPPNWKRMADSRRSAKSAWPREAKRSYRAALSTGVGTASSMAAAIV